MDTTSTNRESHDTSAVKAATASLNDAIRTAVGGGLDVVVELTTIENAGVPYTQLGVKVAKRL